MIMRGKHGGHQASRSNGPGSSRKKESRQHLLGTTSPPESPVKYNDFMPLDADNFNMDVTPFNTSFGDEGKELIFEEAHPPEPLSIMSSLSMSSSSYSLTPKSKLKYSHRGTLQVDNKFASYESFDMRSPSSQNYSPEKKSTDHYHTPSKSVTTKFLAVPSANGVETPVLKELGGAAATMKQQQYRKNHNNGKSYDQSLYASKASEISKDIDGENDSLPKTAHSSLSLANSPPSVKDESSTPSKSLLKKGKGKVSRLAKMFSSRAFVSSDQSTPSKTKATSISDQPPQTRIPTQKKNVVSSPNRPQKTTKTPRSPTVSVASSISAPYTAWPGTQDGLGRTITMPKDDDTASRTTAFSEDNNAKPASEKEQPRDATQDMEAWMNAEDRSVDESSFEGDEDENDEDIKVKGENPADRHLAALVKEALNTPLNSSPKALQSPKTYSKTSYSSPYTQKSIHQNSFDQSYTTSNKQLSIQTDTPALQVRKPPINGRGKTINIQNLFTDNENFTKERKEPEEKTSPDFDLRGSERRVMSSGRDMSKWKERMTPTKELKTYPIIQPLSEAALAAQNKLSPLPRHINGARIKGYRGFIDKTSDMPNLMDDESITVASSSVAPSGFIENEYQNSSSSLLHNNNRTYAKSAIGVESDIFEGLPPSPLKRSSNISSRVASSPMRLSSVGIESDSDIFDGLSNADSGPSDMQNGMRNNTALTSKINKVDKKTNMVNVVNIGNGLISFQVSQQDLKRRRNAKDFDADLSETENETDVHRRDRGERTERSKFISSNKPNNIVSPDERKVLGKTKGRAFETDSSSFQSDEDEYTPKKYQGDNYNMNKSSDLSMYYIQPKVMRKLVRKFRKMCQDASSNSSERDNFDIDDAKKAFALFEMRSRIMETDIERGLERRGGTSPVDDLALTPGNLAGLRVRDIVIVSKAWRDGASPQDVVTAALLTRRHNHTHYIKRLLRNNHRLTSPESVKSFNSDFSFSKVPYYLEEVKWMDDLDLTRMRCPSLGPTFLRGAEIFTIGDCQSMLLKLTNERCMHLRQELDDATARQISAEIQMNEEDSSPDAFSDREDDMSMTEAEIVYLSAMADVKAKSRQLVVAEKSHELVKNQIEMLVTQYQTLLLAIENEEDDSDDSVSSSNSSESGDQYDSEVVDHEKDILARRAQRAELRAEVAAREVLIAKEEVQRIRAQKQAELDALQERLHELETKSVLEREEFERRLDFERQSAAYGSHVSNRDAQTFLRSSPSNAASESTKQNSKERVKAMFRTRYAERVKSGPQTSPNVASSSAATSTYSNPLAKNSSSKAHKEEERDHNHTKLRLNEEEMFQHVEFYERSLKAARNSNTHR